MVGVNWRDDEVGVFKLGLAQGLICLVCCWALMAVMFVAGLMNLFWMAALAAVMVLEKTVPNPKPLVYGTGVVLIISGVARGPSRMRAGSPGTRWIMQNSRVTASMTITTPRATRFNRYRSTASYSQWANGCDDRDRTPI